MDYVYIGGVRIEKTAVLAPMAGVCDYAQRVLCREFGAALVFGEMASSAGLVYGDKKTPKLLACGGNEKPFAAQIFGNKPDYMARAAEIAAEYKPDIIDINSGCPMPKITGGGAGSALLKTPKLLGEIVQAVVRTAEKTAAGKFNETKCRVLPIPVTVKIRTGWNESSINAVETAKICEANGAAAITVHARTREQFYSGTADWSRIAEVKRAVKIPVIGNGDVTSAEKCRQMYEQTGCDLVMIGRAAWGAPWIFNMCDGNVTLEKRLEVMMRHIELLISDKGERVAMKQARAHAAKYLRGLRGAAFFRNQCASLTTQEDFLNLIEKIRNEYENN
ncbi:MAG: tRNA dihydrouridine synthase DusB [Oscillospiraceae bacterium]|nr:tRNA dihydrouridine synthase DusB [Oscillospiraceae bacterium]